MQASIQTLVVEDSEPDFFLLCDQLKRSGVNAHCVRVDDEPQMTRALRSKRWDLVISDHQLPNFSSFQALKVLREHDPFLPFLIVSGTIGEELAVSAMHAGADDYLVKGRLARLGPAIERALVRAELRRERDAAHEALTESKHRLHELSEHLQRSREDERRAIAREIHDDVGSSLTALRFDLDWLARAGDVAIVERTKQALTTLEQAQAACQRLIRDLRPPILEAGLVPALQWLSTQFKRRHAIELQLRTNRDTLTLSESAQLVVFRTVQEALNNIAKHSGATRASIDLVQSDSQLSVEISDNGRGFSAADLRKTSSFGIQGLTERAMAAGGWLEVSSTPHGTVMLLILTDSGQLT